MQTYIQTHVEPHEIATTTQEAVIVRARFGGERLTLNLSSVHGTVIAVLGDVAAALELIKGLGAEHPEQLHGKKVRAHFSARKLVGLSPA